MPNEISPEQMAHYFRYKFGRLDSLDHCLTLSLWCRKCGPHRLDNESDRKWARGRIAGNYWLDVWRKIMEMR